MKNIIIASGSVMVLVLSIYAGYLWQQVWYQRKKKQEYNAYVLEKKQNWVESIVLIARALVAGQANITECAIRIKVLLDNVYEGECPKLEFRAIYELMWATSHMPILEQRKQYTRKEIQAFDDEREALEKIHEDSVIKAVKFAINYDFQADLNAMHNGV